MSRTSHLSSLRLLLRPPTGRELRELLVPSLPLIVINLAITGMQFTDTVMVAPLGEEALAAIFPASMIYFLPVAFGHGLLSSVNTFVSQSLGRGRPEDCGRHGAHGLLLATLLGLGMLPAWFLAPWLFRQMAHPPEVQALEIEYFRWVLPNAWPSLVVTALSNFFSGLLRTRVLMAAALLATVLNVGLNWVFIFGHFGFPALGMAGAALATVMASVIQAVFLLAFYWREPLRSRYRTWCWTIDRGLARSLVKIGAPAGLMPLFDLFTWGVLIIWMIGLFGTAHLAANTIVVRYLHLAFMPPLAVGTIVTSLVGHALGARQPELADRRALAAYQLIGAYMVAIGLGFLLLREPLMRVFTQDPVIIAAGGGIFICAALYQAFDAMYLTFSHALRGAGDTLWPTLALVVFSLTVLVGGSYYLVTVHPGLASLGPWIATTVYCVFLGLAMFGRWLWGPWRRIELL